MLYCPYLWKSQCILSNSKVLPCCHSNAEKWNTLDFVEGISTEKHIKARNMLTNNIWPNECKVCEDNENSNIKSARLRANEFFDTTDKLAVSLEYLDIKFDNTCNLSCRMCNPQSSSKIEKLWEGIDTIPNFLKDHKGIAYNTTKQLQLKKLEYAKRCIENGLTHLKVTGGEPFASREFLDLLDWCTKNNYTEQLGLSITTNGTKYNKSLLKKLVKFNYLSLVVSIDGTNKIYDYIRQGTSWEKLNKNCDLFDSFFEGKTEKFCKHNDTIHIATILQFYNVFDIGKLVDWCVQKGYILKVDVNLKPNDSELQVKYLPKELKEEVIKYCDQYIDKYRALDWAYNSLNSVRNYMLQNIEVENINKQIELKNTVLLQDKQYCTNYKDYLDQRQINFLDSI